MGKLSAQRGDRSGCGNNKAEASPLVTMHSDGLNAFLGSFAWHAWVAFGLYTASGSRKYVVRL
jgi:hypothetical protein